MNQCFLRLYVRTGRRVLRRSSMFRRVYSRQLRSPGRTRGIRSANASRALLLERSWLKNPLRKNYDSDLTVEIPPRNYPVLEMRPHRHYPGRRSPRSIIDFSIRSMELRRWQINFTSESSMHLDSVIAPLQFPPR